MDVPVAEKFVVWDLFVIKNFCLYWMLNIFVSAEAFLFGVPAMPAFPFTATSLNIGKCLSFSI